MKLIYERKGKAVSAPRHNVLFLIVNGERPRPRDIAYLRSERGACNCDFDKDSRNLAKAVNGGLEIWKVERIARVVQIT